LGNESIRQIIVLGISKCREEWRKCRGWDGWGAGCWDGWGAGVGMGGVQGLGYMGEVERVNFRWG
jgi:hypothetical protein